MQLYWCFVLFWEFIEIKRIGYGYRHSENFRINRPHGSGGLSVADYKNRGVCDAKRCEAPRNSFVIFKKGSPQFYGASGGKFVNDWGGILKLKMRKKQLFQSLGSHLIPYFRLEKQVNCLHSLKTYFLNSILRVYIRIM